MTTVSLSRVQRQMLAWLWRQHLLVEDQTVANYPALVRVLPTVATRAATPVKSLEQKRLVTLRYASDGQIQSVHLTEAGFDLASQIWIT